MGCQRDIPGQFTLESNHFLSDVSETSSVCVTVGRP
jgi:hypothetical protein